MGDVHDTGRPDAGGAHSQAAQPGDAEAAAADSETLSIALGIDRRYAAHAAATIASVVRHSAAAPLRFLILHEAVEPALRRRVEAAAPGARFVWSEIGDEDVPDMAPREHFSRAILFRLGITQRAPSDWQRVLYIDADAIVAGDLRELWTANLGDRPIGAVADCFVDPDAFAARWGLPRQGAAYFNSGVLIIDLLRAKAERLFDKALEFAAAHVAELRFTDQDALNYAAWGRWKRLDGRWNVQRHMVISALQAEIPADRRLGSQPPGIIHYTGREKPWVRDGYHPWSWLYWKNLSRTPFLAEVARAEGMGPMRRLVLWQRWLRRRRGA